MARGNGSIPRLMADSVRAAVTESKIRKRRQVFYINQGEENVNVAKWRNVMNVETKSDIEALVEHGYADNSGVKIHYVTAGAGPLLLFVHGFPDYWYTWRDQIAGLADDFQVVAIDTRGYNLSDKPQGREHYLIKSLISDIYAVLRHFGKKSATIVGHDWGAQIAWSTAMFLPRAVERLVILNSLHPVNFLRELAGNAEQRKASEYAKNFKTEGFHKMVKVDDLVKWVTDPQDRQKYKEAMEHSDIEAMLSYYQNFPAEPFEREGPELPRIKCPVLHIYGLQDQYLLPAGLNDTWNLIDNEYTLATIPGAGHFVQQDAPEFVTKTISNWLKSHS
jgi:pimeloyl-ACP methyl ester carboxylesterase